MHKVNRAIKYRIYPNESQRNLFARIFGCIRFIWNQMLNDSVYFYDATGKHFIPTPACYKKKNTFLKEVDSLALANAQLQLKAAYSKFFKEKNVGFPKYKTKKHSQNSYTTNNQNGTIALYEKSIKLPKAGYVKAKLHRLPKQDWVLKSATVSQTPTGKYYCSVLFEYEAPDAQVIPTTETTLGLDYSSSDFYVDSHGNIPGVNHYYRNAQNKLRRAQKSLSRKKLNSKRYLKQKQKVALIHEEVANHRKNFCHQLSRKIANSYDAVCVEDINLRGLAGSLRLGKATNDNGFGMFRNMLEYKLAEQGKALIYIDKWYPSSKTCHECGYIHTDLELKDRTWSCPSCGAEVQRDYNAALNIRDHGLLTFFENRSI